MTDTCWWPANYFASRDCFLELAQTCGARTQSRSMTAVGPRGEPLSVEVAALTSHEDEHRIILSSGVHGIEGFIGACIQIHALRRLAQFGIPDRTGIVLIHAVNPWGFAHLRRVDENNVDVNRNFPHSSLSRPMSHAQYAELDPIINPPAAPGIRSEVEYWLRAGRLIARNRGVRKLFRPIAEGQYDFPQGMFFGGHDVSESCRTLQELILGYSADADRVTLLDLHSGLGPWATATLIANSNCMPADKQLKWLHGHYHQPVLIDKASSNTYNAQGTYSQWCETALSDKQFLYLCVEIGTVNPINLFSALRRENQAHHWAGGNPTSVSRTKQALLDVFAPQSLRWRKKAIAQGLKVLDRTVGLSLDARRNNT